MVTARSSTYSGASTHVLSEAHKRPLRIQLKSLSTPCNVFTSGGADHAKRLGDNKIASKIPWIPSSFPALAREISISGQKLNDFQTKFEKCPEFFLVRAHLPISV